MGRVTEDTRLLIRCLKSLNLTEEDTKAVLIILGNPKNGYRLMERIYNLGREPSLEEILTMAEFIRKY